ncbi:protein kinase [bacterium]|nr:protein kinase [bacterium]
MKPEQVGQYEIERKLGSGGMGTVYLGRHRETGQVAAIKVLPASLAREDGFIARFTREVQAMRSLSSPHIVEIYEDGVDDNETYFYAMEYVEGQTVAQMLRESGRIPWQDVIDYSVQICTALKAAHVSGIVHRDLKPSNLIITPDGVVKLLDFGVAQVFASGKLTKTGGIIGTAEYMSPEQAQGRRATKASDIYSLGAVMYAMLTARPPFSGKTSMEVIHKHRFGVFDRPRTYVPDMPHWLDDVVCQCLEKEPEKRFPDAYVLSLRLKEIVKKVELSSLDMTAATGTLDGTAETMIAGGDDPHAVGGTLMRDLLKAEVAKNQEPNTLQRLFDNTWILIGLLMLTIVGGIFWFQRQSLTPEERFQAGKDLYDSGRLYWREARDDYFIPLLEEEEGDWAEKVEPLLLEIEINELRQEFGLTRLTARRMSNMSDPHRFLHLARSYYEMGDLVRTEAILQQLADLLRGDEEQATLRTAVLEILADLKTKAAERRSEQAKKNPASSPLSKVSLKRAQKYLDEDKPEQARAILQSLIDLYDGDSSAQQDVADARQLLETLRKPTP